MNALFNPAYRRGDPIKWGIVSYTAAMFSLVTVGTAMQLRIQSISYIDHRDDPKIVRVPLEYRGLITPDVVNVIQTIIFALTNWLADGLLVSPPFRAASAHSGV